MVSVITKPILLSVTKAIVFTGSNKAGNKDDDVNDACSSKSNFWLNVWFF